MESLVLKKIVMCLSAMSCLILVVTLARQGWQELSSHNSAQRIYASQSGMSSLNASRRYTPPTPEEFRSCKKVVDEIASAYSNCQYEVILQLTENFPRTAYDLRGDDYIRLILPINQIWSEEWRQNENTKEFPSIDGFRRRMLTYRTLAETYGKIVVESEMAADDVLVNIDCGVLERLQRYRDKFANDGKSEFLLVTERLMTDWVSHIESQDGFARACLRAQERALNRLVEHGELTLNDMRRNVRARVRPLIVICGYTPKWLDEEFPLPESDKNQH